MNRAALEAVFDAAWWLGVDEPNISRAEFNRRRESVISRFREAHHECSGIEESVREMTDYGPGGCF